MRNAPSVSHPVGRSRFYGTVLGAAWLAGLGAAVAALAPPRDGQAWRLLVCLAVLAVTGVAAWRAFQRQPVGQLAWTPAGWFWRPGGANASPAEVAVLLAPTVDLQRRLLLRCHAVGQGAGQGAAPRWLWLEAGADREHWLALRRAVHAAGAQPGPRTGSAPGACGALPR